MSVLAFVLKPINDYEKYFSIPVASEASFNKYWLPAIKELKLEWVATFSKGIDITKDDLPNVVRELLQIKEWAMSNLIEEQRNHILERIDLLLNKLPLAFQREDAVVFIG